MRYGCVPLVRETGGLRDSVTGATSRTIWHGQANGVTFEQADDVGFAFGLSKALALFEHKEAWERIQDRGMNSSYSWREAASRYTALYDGLEGRNVEIVVPNVSTGVADFCWAPPGRPQGFGDLASVRSCS